MLELVVFVELVLDLGVKFGVSVLALIVKKRASLMSNKRADSDFFIRSIGFLFSMKILSLMVKLT